MPNIRSRSGVKGDDEPPMKPFGLRSEESISTRKWWCPGERTIAAYADGAVGRVERVRIESHLSRCGFCRLLVSDVVKEGRGISPLAPPELVRQAMRWAVGSPTPSRWVWAPAGALAAAAVATGLMIAVVQRPHHLTIQPPSAPTAPLIAQSKPLPPPTAGTTDSDIVRSSATGRLAVAVVSPRPDSVMPTGGLEFSWTPVPHSHRYLVRVVRSDGDPVWKCETGQPALRVPPNVVLTDGDYFVWITALLDNGQTAKSPPVRFQVKR